LTLSVQGISYFVLEILTQISMVGNFFTGNGNTPVPHFLANRSTSPRDAIRELQREKNQHGEDSTRLRALLKAALSGDFSSRGIELSKKSRAGGSRFRAASPAPYCGWR
jgi:hypothetical protein